MTQKERQERSRREILRAAREEFGSHDYGQVTMESICSCLLYTSSMEDHLVTIIQQKRQNSKQPTVAVCLKILR